MAVGTLATLPLLTDPGLKAAYMAGIGDAPAPLARLAAMIATNTASYQAALVAPPAAFAAQVEGADISTTAIKDTYGASITVSSYSAGFGLSDLARRSGGESQLPAQLKALGRLATRFFESQLAGLYNGAAAATLTADGVSWANALHPSTAGNVSNFLNAALGFSNYALAVQMLMDQTDDRGTVIGGQATDLVVPTDLRVVASQIVGSSYTSNDLSAVNPDMGMSTVSVSPDLTSATRWFLIDRNQMSTSGIKVPVSRGPSPWQYIDPKNQNVEYRDMIHAGFGVVDFRGSVIG